MRAHEFITEHRLVFKKNPKGGISLKWRCESGPRKGRTVPDAAQCSAAPDIKKAAKMKQTRQRTKVAQARKTKKTKRVNPMTKTATRLNKQMRKGLREDIASDIKSQLGIERFDIFEYDDYIKLDTIVVGKENQGKGLGTKALQMLTDYADSVNKRIVLTPGVKDPHFGTTSRARLVRFYKQFGFKESKGRYIDYQLGAGKMYRDPVERSLTESFTPNDFKENIFETMADYRRWMRSPKQDKRGMTRYSVDKYESVISDFITESVNFNTRKKEAKVFSNTFKMLDNRDHVTIEIGKQISVLSTVVVPDENNSRIEVSGFVEPKEISKINLDLNDKIDSIEFSDGSMFPEAAEFTSVSGTNITNTAFFPDYSSASKAYTALWMITSRMEGLGWKVEKY